MPSKKLGHLEIIPLVFQMLKSFSFFSQSPLFVWIFLWAGMLGLHNLECIFNNNSFSFKMFTIASSPLEKEDFIFSVLMGLMWMSFFKTICSNTIPFVDPKWQFLNLRKHLPSLVDWIFNLDHEDELLDYHTHKSHLKTFEQKT